MRELILRLHHYSQTLPDPEAWFEDQAARFQQPEPAAWLGWLMDELSKWRKRWLPVLLAQPAENKHAAQCAQALAGLPEKPDRARNLPPPSRPSGARTRKAQAEGAWRKPMKNIFDEADFLRSVCVAGEADPLVEDWNWCASSDAGLARFGRAIRPGFPGGQTQEGGIDFHDLEQFALRLLWKNGRPSDIAAQWRGKLRLIFVDEYQDINEPRRPLFKLWAARAPPPTVSWWAISSRAFIASASPIRAFSANTSAPGEPTPPRK